MGRRTRKYAWGQVRTAIHHGHPAVDLRQYPAHLYINVDVSARGHETRLITPPNVLTRTPRRLVARIPLEMLGNPERLLISSRTYLTQVPLDWSPWRIVELAEMQ